MKVSADVWQRMTNCWLTWDGMKKTDEVLRSGIIACGTGTIQPSTPEARLERKNKLEELERQKYDVLGGFREETVGGHTFGLVLLMDLANMWLPEFFPGELMPYLRRVAIYHDVTEVFDGDVMDDGRRDAVARAEIERARLKDLFRKTPGSEWIQGVVNRAELMSDAPYGAVDHANVTDELAWWLKAFDKLEAPLQNLRYKTKGMVGRIGLKEDPSERDLRGVEELGGIDTIDFVWALNSLGYTQGTILYELFVAAAHDVYPVEEIPSQFLRP